MLTGGHRLFLALVPDADALDAIERAAAGLRDARVIHGRWVAKARYHMTLRFLGSFSAIPAGAVRRARAVVAALRFAPFEFTFDRIVSFRGRFQSPCVLRCTRESEQTLSALRERIGAALGPGEHGEDAARPFMPHLTVAYADKALADAVPIEPITSRARELVLFASHPGAQGYETM